MILGYWEIGKLGNLEIGIQVPGFRIQDQDSGSGFRTMIQDHNSGFRIRVQDQDSGSGFRIRIQDQDSGFRITIQDSGSGFRIRVPIASMGRFSVLFYTFFSSLIIFKSIFKCASSFFSRLNLNHF